jgi:putative spermidine/putrescine transport system ATP-binding protein
VRPDDLVAQTGGGLTATVVSTEFRGHDFTGFARTADDVELIYTAPSGAPPGSTVQLVAEPERALVFAA